MAHAFVILIVVIVLGVIGFVGWFVWKLNNPDTETRSAQPSSQSKSSEKSEVSEQKETKDEAPYLVINELGIKLPLTENTKDAYYVVGKQSDPNKPPTIKLSVHSLDQYPGCTTSEGGIAYIGNFKPGDSNEVTGDFQTAFPDAPEISGNFYYVGRNQYDCTEQKAFDLLHNARSDFVNSYSGIVKSSE